MYSSVYMKGMRMKLITGTVGCLLICLITNIETAPTSKLLSKLVKEGEPSKNIYTDDVNEQADEDVLELEELKQTQNNNQDEEGDVVNVLPALEKQLILEAAAADRMRKQENVEKVQEKGQVNDAEKLEEKGQIKDVEEVEEKVEEINVDKEEDKEDEEKAVEKIEEKAGVTEEADEKDIDNKEEKIPHRDVENTEIVKEKEMDIIAPDENTNIPKVKLQTFYGAARLAFGQKPETVSSSSTTAVTTLTPTTIQTEEIIEDIPLNISNATANTNSKKRSGIGSKSPEYILHHSGEKFSAFDMAQYVFWTGDEVGVAEAVEEFIEKGLMSRENAIKFLHDISIGIQQLQNVYSNRQQVDTIPYHSSMGSLKSQTEIHSQSSITSVMQRLIEHLPTISTVSDIELDLIDYEEMTAKLQIANFLNNEYLLEIDMNQLHNEESLQLPTTTMAPVTNLHDTLPFYPIPQNVTQNEPMVLKLNKIKDNSIDDEEMAGRLRLADFLYTEYSLEEVIYQLAKVMFSQSLIRGSDQAQRAIQRLTDFLESEGSHGRISPALQKKVLDVLLTALSDCLAEHPELRQIAKVGLGGGGSGSMEQIPNTNIDANQ